MNLKTVVIMHTMYFIYFADVTLIVRTITQLWKDQIEKKAAEKKAAEAEAAGEEKKEDDSKAEPEEKFNFDEDEFLKEWDTKNPPIEIPAEVKEEKDDDFDFDQVGSGSPQ